MLRDRRIHDAHDLQIYSKKATKKKKANGKRKQTQTRKVTNSVSTLISWTVDCRRLETAEVVSLSVGDVLREGD